MQVRQGIPKQGNFLVLFPRALDHWSVFISEQCNQKGNVHCLFSISQGLDAIKKVKFAGQYLSVLWKLVVESVAFKFVFTAFLVIQSRNLYYFNRINSLLIRILQFNFVKSYSFQTSYRISNQRYLRINRYIKVTFFQLHNNHVSDLWYLKSTEINCKWLILNSFANCF